MANSPRILNTAADKHRSGTEAMQKPASQFIVAPRAQASRRCETQAPLGGKPQAMLPFRSLDPFRPLREPDRRRRDEERLSRSEQRTANKPKDHLTGKAPYRFESASLQRRVRVSGDFALARREKRARYCIIFVSKEYRDRKWTVYQARSAQARAPEERGNEYILPIRVDDIELEGLLPTIGYVPLNAGIERIGEMLVKKLLSPAGGQ